LKIDSHGPLEYGAAFLAQLNYANWLGALVFTVLGGLSFLATRRALQRICNRAQSETLLELGQVSEAERLAHEALELEGDRPDLLWVLAQINVLKDRPKAARIFLNALRQVPFQCERAETRPRELDRDQSR
jgi:hypothetical protein